MNLPAWHNHISEREPDGSWEDCTWDSGVEWYRLVRDKGIPATHAEAQALRAASGEPSTGGSNIGDLRLGIRRRYGWVAPIAISGFANLWAALTPGTSAVVQGSMSAFGPTHRLSRWQTNFDGAHAVQVMRLDEQDRVWWCDPLATDRGYNGEWVAKAELAAFVKAFGGQHLVSSIITEEVMEPLTSYTPGYTASVKVTANIRSAPVLTASSILRVSKGESWVIIGTVKGAVDPDGAVGSADQWYIRWAGTQYEYTAKSNVTKLVAPVTDCTAAVKAATDPLNAQIADLNTQLAAAQQDALNAAAAEKERIAVEMGNASADAIRQA